MMEALVAPPGVKRLTGTIESAGILLSPTSAEAIDARHSGSYVLFIFDPDVDKDLATYVDSNALADDSGKTIFAMYQLPSHAAPDTTLEQFGVKGVVEASPLVVFATEIFGGKPRASPGMLVLGRLSSKTNAVYIALNRPDKDRPIADRVREALRMIAEATKPGTDEVLSADDLGAALALKNIDYSRSEPITVREGFFKMLGTLWAHRSDIAALVKFGVSLKTGGAAD
jgi:hypothetical protein